MSHALLLVDRQKDCFPGGGMALAGILEAGEVVFAKHFANSFSLCGVERLAPRPFFLSH